MITRWIQMLLVSLVLSMPLPSWAEAFKNIVVFGDSLSDNGNLASLPAYSFLNQPPYMNGFTNGTPAVVQLAGLLKVPLVPALYLTGGTSGNNYAVAGARAAGITGIDLITQVGAYLAKTGSITPIGTLYIVFIGGNDIRDMRDQKNEFQAGIILKKAAQNINFALSQLIMSGAKDIMVVNSPDIGRLPETRLIARATKNYSLIVRANLKTRAYNEALSETVRYVERNRHVDIVLFDIYTFFNNIVKDSRAYRFANAREACVSSVITDNLTYYPYCEASRLDDFVFFDEIHPTRRVHERVGRALFAAVPEAHTASAQ